MSNLTESPNGFTLFDVIDTNTEEKLATLPTTIPIGDTLEAFTRAGYSVKWDWHKIECPNHQGSFDCTPFCPLCEGEQEYNPNEA